MKTITFNETRTLTLNDQATEFHYQLEGKKYRLFKGTELLVTKYSKKDLLTWIESTLNLEVEATAPATTKEDKALVESTVKEVTKALDKNIVADRKAKEAVTVDPDGDELPKQFRGLSMTRAEWKAELGLSETEYKRFFTRLIRNGKITKGTDKGGNPIRIASK